MNRWEMEESRRKSLVGKLPPTVLQHVSQSKNIYLCIQHQREKVPALPFRNDNEMFERRRTLTYLKHSSSFVLSFFVVRSEASVIWYSNTKSSYTMTTACGRSGVGERAHLSSLTFLHTSTFSHKKRSDKKSICCSFRHFKGKGLRLWQRSLVKLERKNVEIKILL